jgi:hypothetical protein
MSEVLLDVPNIRWILFHHKLGYAGTIEVYLSTF